MGRSRSSKVIGGLVWHAWYRPVGLQSYSLSTVGYWSLKRRMSAYDPKRILVVPQVFLAAPFVKWLQSVALITWNMIGGERKDDTWLVPDNSLARSEQTKSHIGHDPFVIVIQE